MQSRKCLISLNGKCDLEITNEQIIFYQYFKVHVFSELCLGPETVLKLFMGMRTGKAHALMVQEIISLKECVEQLTDVF